MYSNQVNKTKGVKYNQIGKLETLYPNKLRRILSISLLDRTPIREIHTKSGYKDVKELDDKQLKISGF